MNWYYVKAGERVGPVPGPEWERLVGENEIGPQTLVWRDGLERWTPYGELAPAASAAPDASADSGEPEPAAVSAADPLSFASQIRECDYRLSLRACLGNALGFLSRSYLPLLGITLLVLAILHFFSLHPVTDFLFAAALSEVFLGGLYAAFLHTMRTGDNAFGLVFSGFSAERFFRLIGKSLWERGVILLNAIVVVLILALSGIITPGMTPDDLSTEQTLMLFFVGGIVMIPCFYFIICWTFATPLIMDYRMPLGEAMKLSREKVLQHPWRISFGIALSILIALSPLFIAVPLSQFLGFANDSAQNPFHLVIALTLPFFFAFVLAMYEAIFTLPARS